MNPGSFLIPQSSVFYQETLTCTEKKTFPITGCLRQSENLLNEPEIVPHILTVIVFELTVFVTENRKLLTFRHSPGPTRSTWTVQYARVHSYWVCCEVRASIRSFIPRWATDHIVVIQYLP